MAFTEEGAAYYARYRRSYPPAVFDHVMELLGVGRSDFRWRSARNRLR